MPRDYPYLIAKWLTVLFPLWLLMGNAPPDIAMSTIAVLFLLHSYLAKDWRWCDEPWVRCMGNLWSFMVMRGAIADYHFYAADHAAFAENSFEALRRALPFGRYFVFAAALAHWTLRDPANRRMFRLVLAATVSLLAADCILQWLVGKDVIGRPLVVDPGSHHVRLTGPYNSPIPGIMLAWLFFPACLPLLMPPQGLRNRGRELLKGVAVCVKALAAIALSGERLALIFTLAGWLPALLFLPQRRALLGAFAAGLVALGIVAAISPDTLTRQGATTLHVLADWRHSPYGILLDTDIRLAKEHPLFGAGSNYFRINCPKLYPGYDKSALSLACNTHPHNIYMEWLIDEGLLGLGLFIAFIVQAVKLCIKAWPSMRTNPFFIGCAIAFFMRVWPLAPSTNFSSPFGAPPFWLVVGAMLACIWDAKQEEKPVDDLPITTAIR